MRMAMIAMTTNNSINVNAETAIGRRRGDNNGMTHLRDKDGLWQQSQNKKRVGERWREDPKPSEDYRIDGRIASRESTSHCFFRFDFTGSVSGSLRWHSDTRFHFFMTPSTAARPASALPWSGLSCRQDRYAIAAGSVRPARRLASPR